MLRFDPATFSVQITLPSGTILTIGRMTWAKMDLKTMMESYPNLASKDLEYLWKTRQEDKQ